MMTSMTRSLWLVAVVCLLAACGDAGDSRQAEQGRDTQLVREADLPAMPGEAAPVMVQVPERNPWQVASVSALSLPPDARRPTLQLDADSGQVSGFAGVNRFSGSYELGADYLSFGALGATRMGGPPELMVAEQIYLEALSRVDGWRMRDGRLELLMGNTVLMGFVPHSEAL